MAIPGVTVANFLRAATRALASGSTSRRPGPKRRAASASASAPRTGRSAPARLSSPANSQCASAVASIWPSAASSPSAIGRSKRPDSLGRSAGARFTVTRLLSGKPKPLCCKAARTRSRDSLTSVSARPTRVKLGSPLASWTSTCTGGASSPSRARLWTRASDMQAFWAAPRPRASPLRAPQAPPGRAGSAGPPIVTWRAHQGGAMRRSTPDLVHFGAGRPPGCASMARLGTL